MVLCKVRGEVVAYCSRCLGHANMSRSGSGWTARSSGLRPPSFMGRQWQRSFHEFPGTRRIWFAERGCELANMSRNGSVPIAKSSGLSPPSLAEGSETLIRSFQKLPGTQWEGVGSAPRLGGRLRSMGVPAIFVFILSPLHPLSLPLHIRAPSVPSSVLSHASLRIPPIPSAVPFHASLFTPQIW